MHRTKRSSRNCHYCKRIKKNEVNRIFDSMEKVKGEIRRVYKCNECGNLIGRRFIPYGTGKGLIAHACQCYLTQIPNTTFVAERKP